MKKSLGILFAVILLSLPVFAYAADGYAVCCGGSPGYWKNWQNHYTPSEFTSFLNNINNNVGYNFNVSNIFHVASLNLTKANAILSTNNPAAEEAQKFTLSFYLNIVSGTIGQNCNFYYTGKDTQSSINQISAWYNGGNYDTISHFVETTQDNGRCGYISGNLCGNGIIEGTEECDDGNNINGDRCSADCNVEYCGDNIQQEGLGEECDDGNFLDGDGCSSTCKREYCGDGIKNIPTEQCDPPESSSNYCGGYTCLEDCTCQGGPGLFCGDGMVNQAWEECDDGNNNDGDGCSSGCKIELLNVPEFTSTGVIVILAILTIALVIFRNRK